MTSGADRAHSAAKLLERAQDPVWFIERVLRAPLWPMQRAIAESVAHAQETVVAACHGPGKSFLAARLVTWWLCAHKSALALTTAPTDRQVRGILWKEIAASHKRAAIPLGGRLLTQEWHLAEDRFALGFTAPGYDPDRFQGWHSPHVLVCVDEACGVSPQIMGAIDGVLTGPHARKLSIGNPTDPSSAFAQDFKRKDVSKFHISAFDTPNFTALGIGPRDIETGEWEAKIAGKDPPWPNLVTPQWVARVSRKWGTGSALYIAKVLGQFPEASADTLFPLVLVESVFGDVVREAGPHILAVDVARYGDNSTVLFERHGAHGRTALETRKESTMATVGRVVDFCRAHTGIEEVRVDECGIGGGVLDRLLELGVPAIGVNGGSPHVAEKDRYANVRAEMYGQLSERMIAGDCVIEADDDLSAQLNTLRRKYRSTGQMLLESKDEMRKRGVASPDKGDACAMAFYEPAFGAGTGAAVGGALAMPTYSY